VEEYLIKDTALMNIKEKLVKKTLQVDAENVVAVKMSVCFCLYTNLNRCMCASHSSSPLVH
jgi:hypothetical protein